MGLKWQDVMWTELDEMTPLQRHVAAGEWITEMQQTLVPELAAARRESLLEAVEETGGDYYTIAESIGSRKSAVERLANEARALRREHQANSD